jgi:hypothetical protein
MWDVILPVDFHIFQDGYCTTKQLFLTMDMATANSAFQALNSGPIFGVPSQI